MDLSSSALSLSSSLIYSQQNFRNRVKINSSNSLVFSFTFLWNVVIVGLVGLAISSSLLFTHAQDQIACEGALTIYNNEQDLYNYDCSNLKLNWRKFPKLMYPGVHYSTDLNLANNNFDRIIPNKSFDPFVNLNRALNLSNNQFDTVEENAFFYYDANFKRYVPLAITLLDLSNNRFASLPWNSIKRLGHLKQLLVKSNPFLTRLDLGDMILNGINRLYFSNLTSLDLSHCQIEYVDPSILHHLYMLERLDLSSNNLRWLSWQTALPLARLDLPHHQRTFSFLNVHDNPLKCDCHLLWLKKFLSQYTNYMNATCLMNVTHSIKISDELHHHNERTRSLMIKSDALANNTLNETLTTKTMTTSMSEFIYEKKIPILLLDDEQFVCDLELINTNDFRNDSSYFNEIEIKCVVESYPNASIWWTSGKRVLSKTTSDTNDEYSIDVNIITSRQPNTDNDYSPRPFRFESTLTLTDLGSFENGEFACHATHDFQGYKVRKLRYDNEEIHDMTILDPIDLLRSSESLVQPVTAHKTIRFFTKPSIFSKFTRESHGYRGTPLLFWILLIVCVLFSILLIIFVILCLCCNRRKSKNRKEEPLYAMNSSTASPGDYSANYSYEWKDGNTYAYRQYMNSRPRTTPTSTYLTPESYSSPNADLELMQPLKPDVIRLHVDHSPVYVNTNSTKSTRIQSLPSSSRSSSNRVYYSSPRFSFKTDQQRPYRKQPIYINYDQSLDNEPIDTSILTSGSYGNDPSTTSSYSSRSFDENIEEYKDPKFDDLRKPVAKTQHLYQFKEHNV